MALWKLFRGNRADLDAVEKHDGYVYFCDNGTLFYDYTDADGNLQRKQINAKDAETLGTHSADEFLLSSDLEDVLAQAKASGEFDGEDGVSVTHSWNGTTLTVTSASGTSSVNLKGDPGTNGTNGTNGVGVSSIQQTTTSTADDGNNIITVTLTNGNTSTFTIQNGSKGSTGGKGDKGDAGYSPVRGTDYWTASDKAEIKAYVDEAILNGAW